MATDFIMPRLPGPPQNAFFQAQQQNPSFPPPQQYNATSCYNPQISPLSTSGNASPTTPKSYHTRQLRPLYMPAVLRPTEHPSKAPPARPKPEDDDADADDDDLILRPTGSFISLPGLGPIGIGRLSRRSTGDSGKCMGGGWNLDMFPEVNGLPSRGHWKPDPESAICDEPTCKRHFSYFTRRHHCRRCGNIFCDAHSAYEVPLDEKADYNPRGAISRSCAHCYSEFKTWRSRTNSQASSDAASPPQGAGAAAARPITSASPILASSPTSMKSPAVPTAGGPPNKAITVEAAHSVPRDWNWSTF